VVDGRYLDYAVEREAVELAGGTLVESGAHPVTESDVLALPGLSTATLLLVELAPITREVLAAATSCVAVIRYGTGFDNVDAEAAKEFGIAVESVPAYAAQSVSEHTLLLMLAAARRLLPHVDRVRDGEWRGGDVALRPTGLAGRTLGIIGVGAIGRAVASRASAFGMRVLATDPYVDPLTVDASFELVDLEVLRRESDYVSLNLPLNDHTRGMVNREWLERGKRGVVLLNTARGGLINEQDLLEALDDGLVSYAALDVSVDEPLPEGHPFRHHPKILFTPHVAFWSDQAELALRTAVAEIAVRQLTEGALR
jgi:D-3-phosphoglycerate dehydrogenase